MSPWSMLIAFCIGGVLGRACYIVKQKRYQRKVISEMIDRVEELANSG